MSEKDSEFDKFAGELIENIKTPEMLITRRTLAALIESNEDMHKCLCEEARTEKELICKDLIGTTLKHLKLINQRLGYEQES